MEVFGGRIYKRSPEQRAAAREYYRLNRNRILDQARQRTILCRVARRKAGMPSLGMSAAARLAASQRMKAYWANKRGGFVAERLF